jgi:REP element-mobilizing transposase RayT
MMHSAVAVRRSLRLPSFDYATAGAYFVTAVTHRRACVFGELTETDGAVHLNITGEMVRRWWNLIPQKFSSVTLDSFIVMPDHFHAIGSTELLGGSDRRIRLASARDALVQNNDDR